MSTYTHTVHYYETDKMGITHHSNYIRFMEEARLHYLAELGYPMTWLEAQGIASPVVAVSCQYRKATTYDDKIQIQVQIREYSGVRLTLSYLLLDAGTGETVATAESSHCFTNSQGRPVALRKAAPDLDRALREAIS